MIYLCQMQQLHTPDFLERSFGYTAPIPDLIWDHVLWDRISRCTKIHVYIYIYWSLTFLSLSRKLDMYPKSDVLSSSVRLKHYIFKRLYIIFTHTHLYIPSMLFERKSKKLFLLDSYGVPQKKHRWSFQVALGHPATRVAALRDRSPHPVDYTWCNHQF